MTFVLQWCAAKEEVLTVCLVFGYESVSEGIVC